MDVPSLKKFIQNEETVERIPVSESVAQKCGGSINWIFDNLEAQAVGTVDGSLLTEVQYQLLRGPGWVLCDGRNVVGSRYTDITGNANIPDARGLFLRMKSYGKVVSGTLVNPDDLALGASQADDNKSHFHDIQVSTFPRDVFLATPDLLIMRNNPTGFYEANSNGRWDPSFTINPFGANEMRPAVVTVNWFVRIN